MAGANAPRYWHFEGKFLKGRAQKLWHTHTWKVTPAPVSRWKRRTSLVKIGDGAADLTCFADANPPTEATTIRKMSKLHRNMVSTKMVTVSIGLEGWCFMLVVKLRMLYWLILKLKLTGKRWAVCIMEVLGVAGQSNLQLSFRLIVLRWEGFKAMKKRLWYRGWNTVWLDYGPGLSFSAFEFFNACGYIQYGRWNLYTKKHCRYRDILCSTV